MRLKLWQLLLLSAALLILALMFIHRPTPATKKSDVFPGRSAARKQMPALKKPPARVVKSVENVANEAKVTETDDLTEDEKKLSEWYRRSCSAISYDENGDEVERRFDHGCDGTFDECWIKQVDESGNEITYFDKNCDGTTDSCNIIVEDDHGNPLRHITDEKCDGSDDHTICMSYTYDADGLKISSRSDFSCDGKILYCTSFEYDENGFEISNRSDEGCDEKADNCFSRENDADGHMALRKWDKGCDGTPDECISYDNNEFGKPTLIKRDEGCDLKPDNCDYYIYDADGFLLETRGDPGCRNLAEWEKAGRP